VNVRLDTGAGELHAKFMESTPNGSHTLPLALRLVLPLVAQPVAYQRLRMMNTVDAGMLST